MTYLYLQEIHQFTDIILPNILKVSLKCLIYGFVVLLYMLHAYYFFGGKNVCFIHVESLDEQSLKYMLDRCSQKGKNRVCLMRWHIPYSGQ